MTDETTLHEMFFHALKDMYYAERKIHRSLPKVIKAAKSEKLKNALTAHREETEGQIATLEKIFASLGKKPKGEKCDAIDGILKEMDGVIADFGKTNGCDAAIVFAGQAVEHYEITRYGTMRVWAEQLGMTTNEKLLAKLRDEERAADEKMTKLAESEFNAAAAESKE